MFGVKGLVGCEVIFATMSSDEFKKDKHYPKKNFFYGICLFGRVKIFSHFSLQALA